MKRAPTWLLAALLGPLVACQIHHPELGPNVERLDTEREQLDHFVATQKPLPENEDLSVREACTREVEAKVAQDSAQAWNRSAMDTAVRECANARQPN